MKLGFDSEKYIGLQTEEILKRAKMFDNKLYIEFGGKLFDDYHAARVLPGLYPDIKLRVLKSLGEDVEILYCVSAKDIEKNRIRGDNGLTYDLEVLRGIDELRKKGLYVGNIVITLYDNQPSAKKFAEKLKQLGESVYIHTFTKGYPSDIKTIVSDEGYGANPYIQTTRPIVLVTAPGACSGKLATCLSQLYHEHKRGKKVGYAKYETFPIWNLPVKHPVNVAYEAATADINDVNMIDPYYLEATGKVAVNYNRDIAVYPVLKEILTQITGSDNVYNSPTAMGVNMAGYAITDDTIVSDAARQEIIRRYYRYLVEAKKGRGSIETANNVKILMNELKIDISERKCVGAAVEKLTLTGKHSVAIELDDGTIVTGKTQQYLTAPAGAMLNAIKHLCGISDDINLIPTNIIEAIINLKRSIINSYSIFITLKDALVALAIASNSSDLAKKCLEKVKLLKGCELHSTCILHSSDENNLRNLGLNVTCDPEFIDNSLYENNI